MLLQQDDEALQGENDSKSGTLLHDHEVLQEKMEKVIDGGDVKALFPISHNEKNYILKIQKKTKTIGSQRLIMWKDSLLVELCL